MGNNVTGERLKALRGDAWNQQGVANATGMSQATYSDWENNPPRTLRHLIALAAHFGVSADYLLGITDDPTPAPDRRQWSPLIVEMANNLAELPLHRQEEMARALAGMVARHRAETDLSFMRSIAAALVGAETVDHVLLRLHSGDNPEALLGTVYATLDDKRQKDG